MDALGLLVRVVAHLILGILVDHLQQPPTTRALKMVLISLLPSLALLCVSTGAPGTLIPNSVLHKMVALLTLGSVAQGSTA